MRDGGRVRMLGCLLGSCLLLRAFGAINPLLVPSRQVFLIGKAAEEGAGIRIRLGIESEGVVD
ncbi:MAG: hypothetical protein ACREMY_33540, partial [bacterium]